MSATITYRLKRVRIGEEKGEDEAEEKGEDEAEEKAEFLEVKEGSDEHELISVADSFSTCLLWDFGECPFCGFVGVGGDEDFVAFIPASAKEPYRIRDASPRIAEYLLTSDRTGRHVGTFLVGYR